MKTKFLTWRSISHLNTQKYTKALFFVWVKVNTVSTLDFHIKSCYPTQQESAVDFNTLANLSRPYWTLRLFRCCATRSSYSTIAALDANAWLHLFVRWQPIHFPTFQIQPAALFFLAAVTPVMSLSRRESTILYGRDEGRSLQIKWRKRRDEWVSAFNLFPWNLILVELC